MRFVCLLSLAACYTNAPANRDVQASWRGRATAEIVDRWGGPQAQNPGALGWSYTRTHIELPSGNIVVGQGIVATAQADGPGAHATAAFVAPVVDTSGFRPGEIWKVTHTAMAFTEPSGHIADVQGEALHWGPPNDVNLHWGTIFGAHVGMGRLDNTGTPLPSGGAYIGGMIGPTLGLVGTYSLAFGTGDAGGAMGMAGGFAAQYWPMNRMWLRGGPALLLVTDPGFTNTRLEPGVTLGASYAFVKVGTFALDLRLDMNGGQGVLFGTLGVGVNAN